MNTPTRCHNCSAEVHYRYQGIILLPYNGPRTVRVLMIHSCIEKKKES